MSRRKKKFSCGHKGYGQVCHKCEQQHIFLEKKKQNKDEWQATYTQDSIDLRALPKNVAIKAREIIKALQAQQSYLDFHGKRLRHDRLIISIPVTRNYRLLCRDYGSYINPESVVSHEDYNVCKPRG